MGLLLLLTSTLLSSYFHQGRVMSAQISFTIRDISLSIEPSTDVTRGTNVTLRCQAIVSRSGHEALSREYTIYRDNNVVYTKTTSASEDLLYPLPDARVSNNGKYKCMIKIEDKERTSEAKKLTVTGLSKPSLHINNSKINEGDELTARCTAPGETGRIFFYFYEDSKEIQERQVNSNQVEAKFRPSSTGSHNIHCAYTVLITPESFKSEESNTVTVSVRELPITVVLEISPRYNIFEGDRLVISCTISNFLHGSEKAPLILSQGTKLLSFGETKVNHTMDARAQDPGEFECKLEMGNIVKVATKTISVTELFSMPNITMTPSEVFEGDNMNIICKSSYASERLRKEELSYTLRHDGPQGRLSNQGDGVFSGRVLQNFTCTCVAQAKGIVKYSETLTVRPKVHVTTPEISVVGKAVLRRSFRILCKSNNGSLPINYTLMKEGKSVNSAIITLPDQQAFFTVTINSADEINKYMCKAKNGPKEGLLSKRLDATVVVPLSNPTLTVLPSLSDISEGDDLYLICSIIGSPPVTFKWYRVGNIQPLHTITSDSNHSDYSVNSLSKDHSGSYYCEALNYANNQVRSGEITIHVHMALWKKVVIGGFCLLAVAVLVVVLVLFFKSKRVRVDRATVSVWTKRPPEDDEDNDEESSVVSNEPDVEYTEVVHPRPVDPARVPLRKGTDTVYSELQNSPHGAADHHAYGSVEYAALNGEQPEINHYYPEVNNYQDLPEPVD